MFAYGVRSSKRGSVLRTSALLGALIWVGAAGCTSGVTDSSSLTECVFIQPSSTQSPETFDCTCPNGGTGYAYCLPSGKIEACRCDGTRPDFPDASVAPDGAAPPPMSTPDAAAPDAG